MGTASHKEGTLHSFVVQVSIRGLGSHQSQKNDCLLKAEDSSLHRLHYACYTHRNCCEGHSAEDMKAPGSC